MRKIREVLRLYLAAAVSIRAIARSVGPPPGSTQAPPTVTGRQAPASAEVRMAGQSLAVGHPPSVLLDLSLRDVGLPRSLPGGVQI